MKTNKLKIIMIFIILLLLLVIFSNKTYAADDYLIDNYEKVYEDGLMHGFTSSQKQTFIDLVNKFEKDNPGASAVGQRLMIGNTTLQGTNKLYCIEHYKKLDTVRMFKVIQCLEIDGDVATIAGTGTSRKNNANIILSQLLTRGEMKYGPGYSSKPPTYTDTQMSLYMYLNTWLNDAPDGVKNIDYFNLPGTLVVTSEEQSEAMASWSQEQKDAWKKQSDEGWAIVSSVINEVSTAIKEGRVDSYYRKVKLYFLEHVGEKEVQHLLIAIPENRDIELNIYKIDKQTRAPLANVGFKVKNETLNKYLYYNETTKKIEYVDNENQAGIFKTDSTGYISIKGIKEGTYKVIETEPIPGYEGNFGKYIEVIVRAGGYSNTYTFENEKTGGKELTVEKVWNDGNNSHNTRPDSIEIQLLQNGTPYRKVTLDASNVIEDNKWSYTFYNLPEKDKDGNEYIYSVVELSVPPGYESIIREVTFNQKYRITNTYKTEDIDIKVNKKWIDTNSANRPSSITVKLLENGVVSDGQKIEYTFSYKVNNSEGSWYEIDKKDFNFNEQVYNIQDTSESGYSEKKKITITFTNRNYKYSDIKIDITLYANGNEIGKATLSKENWSCEFLKLPIKENEAKLSEDNNWQYTFKNLPTTKKNIYISFDKINKSNIMYISITLYANGEEDGTATLRNGNWSCEFLHKPVKENGKEIEYTFSYAVKYYNEYEIWWDRVDDNDFSFDEEEYEVEYSIEEVSVPGYDTSITVNDDGTEYTIKNKEQGYGNVTISGKVWLDDSDGKGNNNDSLYNENSSDTSLEGIIVYWRDRSGNLIKQTKTNSEGYYIMHEEIEIDDHTYSIDMAKYNLLNNSYIEFEYNGLKYTTVAYQSSGENTSKSIESIVSRTNLDNSFDEINNKGVLDSGTLLRTRYMGGNTADLEYDYNYSENKSTVKQGNTDFPVTANTQNVINNLLDGYSETIQYESTFCVYEYWVPGDEDSDGYWQCVDGERKSDWDIQNVNLGLVLREQPDIAITSDIYKVRVIMKNQEYTYYYNTRGLTTAPSDELFDYKVKFSGKYTEEYKRPINPSDISYINYDGNNPEDLQVYVTYNITVKNQSSTLPIEVQEIVNYYDSKYNYDYAENLQNWSHTSKYNDKYDDGTYRAIYNQELVGQRINPGQNSKIVSVEHKVGTDVVKSLINGNDILIKNVFEIYAYSSYYGTSTNCAEEKTAIQLGKVGMQYAGVDLDSAPGSAKMQLLTGQDGKPYLNTQTFEDDTDMAPTFVLCEDPNYKLISGTVWEDSNTGDRENERIGNGTYEAGNENVVEGVQVQLLKIKDDGTTELAYLYYIGDQNQAVREPAVVHTDSSGNYTFGEINTKGIVVDNYVLRYTYGNTTDIYQDTEGNTYSDTLSTKINNPDGSPITGDDGNADNIINARNYKSTIITESPLKEVIKGSGYSIDADEWHINHTDGASVAVDDIEERKTIPSLTYDSFDDKVNMSAYTAPFKVQIEYDTKSQESTLAQQTGNNGEINIGGLEYVGEGDITSGNLTSGTDYENNWRLFDFGIIERAREDIVVDKTIENIKITLANGQVLTEGNPYEDKLDYVKALGDSAIGENAREDAAKANAKFLSIEVDTETIQGARLDILYKITVTNNSEKDYEYEYDYGANIETSSNIIKDNKAYYYYFGEVTTPLIKSTVEWLIDYVDPELTCTVGPGNIATEDVNGVNDDTYIFQENRDTTGTEKIIWMQVTPEVDASGNRTKTAAQRLVDGNLYLDADLNTSNGNEIFVSDDQLISTETDTIDPSGANTLDKLEEENYSIFITNYFYDVVSGTSKSLNLFASKLIANQADEYTYENHTEILQLNGKIARNIDSVNDGKQIDKYYKPGDYIPSLDRNGTVEWLNYREGFHEFDDDMITIRITPPTGLESNAIIYISAGAVALIVLALGIFIIKKKVLGK